jgi:hypothetical protein
MENNKEWQNKYYFKWGDEPFSVVADSYPLAIDQAIFVLIEKGYGKAEVMPADFELLRTESTLVIPKPSQEVDFDNLRLSTQGAFNNLVDALREAWSEDNQRFYLNEVLAERLINELRDDLVMLMCIFEKGVINDISEQCDLKILKCD